MDGLRVLLGGGTAVERLEEALEGVRSQPHGHLAAVLGALRRLSLEAVIAPQAARQWDLVAAMIVERIVAPRSKPAVARGLCPETLASTLGEELGVKRADEEALYAAMVWLVARQEPIERAPAGRSAREGIDRIAGRPRCSWRRGSHQREGMGSVARERQVGRGLPSG